MIIFVRIEHIKINYTKFIGKCLKIGGKRPQQVFPNY